MTAIANSDASQEDQVREYDIDSAADAFSELWEPKDAKKPSKDKAAEDTDDDEKDDEVEGEDTENSKDDETETEDDDGGDEPTEDDEEKDEAEENDSNVVVKDDYKVKVTVDGVEQEFTIGNLKRLAGQEASLTQKSMQVAEKRKELDKQAGTQLAALNVMLERAKAKYEPYAKLNLLAAAKDPNISAEELTALQEAATNAYSDVRFLEQELGSFSKQLADQRAKELREQAAETVKVLSDPEKGITGWSEKLYGEMTSYAVSQGVPEDAVNTIVDPVSLKILHKAMLYDKGVKAVKEVADPKAKAEKKAKAPKKIVKSFGNAAATKEALKGSPDDKAMKRLKSSGSTDDAAEAFLARWSE